MCDHQPSFNWFGGFIFSLLIGVAMLTNACQEQILGQLTHLKTTPLVAMPNPKVHFEPADCAFDLPTEADIDCGYLTVPEDRTQPNSPRTIRLHVAIFRSPNPNPAPDPVVYLHGGPGVNLLARAHRWMPNLFSDILAERDLIAFDQRGTGFSEPNLDCPEITDFVLDTLEQEIPDDEWIERVINTRLTCRERLANQEINLNAFTTVASAADVNDLRLVLGYETWNLYGVSYGTRLALTVMRDHPVGLRSVVLDSVAPHEIDFFAEVPPNAERSFNLLWAECAADDQCHAAYPDLPQVYDNLMTQLAADPLTLEVASPFYDTTFTVRVDDQRLTNLIFNQLYITSVIPRLPRLIYAIQAGDYEELSYRLELSLRRPSYFSEGATYAIWCNEEVPFTSLEQVQHAGRNVYPPIYKNFVGRGQPFIDSGPAFFETCAGWEVDAAPPAENEPVISNIRTLVLAGQYDPITPPGWGQMVAASLTNEIYLEFPGVGHGIMFSGDCGKQVIEAFIHTPDDTLETQCMHQYQPNFALP